LPQLDENDESSVDIELVKKMVDKYMESSFNYFDLGFDYHEGMCEVAFKEAVVDRFPRESYVVADKLPIYNMPKSEDEFEKYFTKQIERTGLEYFDYYMLHNATGWTDNGFKNLDSFKFLRELKEVGKIKHLGISTHDDADFLEEILSEHPEIEFVQLQVNYVDWDNDGIQSGKCCEVANKYGVDIIVMEPIRGGMLVNLSDDIKKVFTDYNPDESLASWALRFCRSIDGVICTLSGMSNLEQLEDNLNSMENFKPLNDEEYEVINKVTEMIVSEIEIPCTYCKYCLSHCPIEMPISRYFELVNSEKRGNGIPGFSIPTLTYINMTKNGNHPKASECDECGACAAICPQQLDIPKYLKETVVPLLERDSPF
ncbi:MAG: aldo/keto reductase, partial [archaeon]|nr:aldo/keto reductase [archaeon]